jgi:hypothetical protein
MAQDAGGDSEGERGRVTMTREEQIEIKEEFDKSIKYLQPRRDAGVLTVGECMQEIGALRLYIYNMKTERKPE